RSSDNSTAPKVAIINEALVTRYFPGVNPLGRQIHAFGDTNGTFTIIGVIANMRTESLRERAEPECYFSFWQSSPFSKHLMVRTEAEPRALAGAIRHELRLIDPTCAVERIKTLEDIRGESIAPQTFAMRLLAGFAVVASVLALVGIYGVLSLSAGSRTREIAVRVAIGAQRREILRMILGEGGRLIATGLALGVVVALIMGRALGAFLFDVQPTDPLTLLGAGAGFALVALLACWAPAHRATNVDPMEALRNE
ncbi:MAG TPA: FtsX-like permease family protein, partial [Verrucomicrobiae bacterium]|nr:FtsX-like permease family protein [Verrucomicrobiae bacterium]